MAARWSCPRSVPIRRGSARAPTRCCGCKSIRTPSSTGRDAFAPDRWFDPLPHKSIGMRENLGPVWSPDGRQMAAIIDGYLHAYPVSRDGAPTASAPPPVRRSGELALVDRGFPPASSTRRLDRFRLVDLDDGRVRDIVAALVVGGADGRRGPPSPPSTPDVSSTAAAPAPARPSTSSIEGNRIRQVEPHRDDLHRGTVVDASGQTVLPGLIESHTHLSKGYGEALGPHLAVVRHHHDSQPGGQPVRGQRGSRGHRLGRAHRPARGDHR